MIRPLFLLSFLLGVVQGCVSPVPVEKADCPCTEGFVCCPVVDYCIEGSHIIDFAYSLLDRLGHNPRELNRLIKSTISLGLELPLSKGLDLEAKKCVEYIIETRQG